MSTISIDLSELMRLRNLLRESLQLLATIPMSFPYNDRAAKLRDKIHEALGKEGGNG